MAGEGRSSAIPPPRSARTLQRSGPRARLRARKASCIERPAGCPRGAGRRLDKACTLIDPAWPPRSGQQARLDYVHAYALLLAAGPTSRRRASVPPICGRLPPQEMIGGAAPPSLVGPHLASVSLCRPSSLQWRSLTALGVRGTRAFSTPEAVHVGKPRHATFCRLQMKPRLPVTRERAGGGPRVLWPGKKRRGKSLGGAICERAPSLRPDEFPPPPSPTLAHLVVPCRACMMFGRHARVMWCTRGAPCPKR